MEIHRNTSNSLHCEEGPAIDMGDITCYFVDGKLHHPTGPAVTTEFGTKTHYWKGVHIDQNLWKKIPTMTATQILTESNIELRRCIIEKYGLDKLCSKVGKIVDTDEKRKMVLYEIKNTNSDDDEDLRVIKVTDGTPLPDGTKKTYFIRVPIPSRMDEGYDANKCLDVVAWTFDVTPGQYKELEAET